MAVQPQTPYKEYTANGSTENFALEFDCENQDHLIVLVDDIEPAVGTWSLSGGAVVFGTAPTTGKKITVQRNTPFRRDEDFQSYDNSFRPPGVNKGFDKIWLKLQELGVADWILSQRIDALKNYVDRKDDELKGYLLEEIRKQGVALDQLEDYYSYLMERLAQIAVDKGWDASFVVYNGQTQKKINDGFNSILEMIAIPNPKDGMRIYVKSYYPGLNAGGGYYTWVVGSTLTTNGGTVFEGEGSGRWIKDSNNVYSIDEFGAHPTISRSINTNSINSALASVKNVFVPTTDYDIYLDQIQLNSRNVLFGKGCFIGPDADAKNADGTGRIIQITSKDTIVIKDITIKNGYKGYGIFGRDSKNIIIDNVTTDGFSYGMCFAELDFNIADTNGCQNILINNPKILNPKYWGIYLRCAGTTTESKKTQNVKIVNPYFYNCNMAGFVASEGNVKNFVLENPVFDRCNVSMHFEHCSDFTVINARDYDTGKKPDHVPANTEYPFVNWSVYHAFSRRAKIINSTLVATVSHLAGASSDTKVFDIEYVNTRAATFVFEGVGAVDTTNKDAFKNISWDRCLSEKEFIYHQPLDEARSWLRDFSIMNSTCLLGQGGNSGSGAFLGINSSRTINMVIDNNLFVNSAIRIAAEECLQVTNNRFPNTDNTHSVLQGLRGGLYGDFLTFTGNKFQRAGGSSGNGSAVTIQGWTSARVDNFMRGLGFGVGYRFENNNRIELGAGMTYDFPSGTYTESGTTEIKFLYNIP